MKSETELAYDMGYKQGSADTLNNKVLGFATLIRTIEQQFGLYLSSKEPIYITDEYGERLLNLSQVLIK